MVRYTEPSKVEGLSIRNRARLPAGQSLMISVTWLRMPSVILLVLGLVGLSFFAGVTAGTGGWYGEAIIWLTRPLGEDSLLRRLVLVPDRTATDTPTMRASMIKMMDRQDAIILDNKSLFLAYGKNFIEFSDKIGQLTKNLSDLGERTEDAHKSSKSTQDHLDTLIWAVKLAQSVRTRESVAFMNACNVFRARASLTRAPEFGEENTQFHQLMQETPVNAYE